MARYFKYICPSGTTKDNLPKNGYEPTKAMSFYNKTDASEYVMEYTETSEAVFAALGADVNVAEITSLDYTRECAREDYEQSAFYNDPI